MAAVPSAQPVSVRVNPFDAPPSTEGQSLIDSSSSSVAPPSPSQSQQQRREVQQVHIEEADHRFHARQQQRRARTPAQQINRTGRGCCHSCGIRQYWQVLPATLTLGCVMGLIMAIWAVDHQILIDSLPDGGGGIAPYETKSNFNWYEWIAFFLLIWVIGWATMALAWTPWIEVIVAIASCCNSYDRIASLWWCPACKRRICKVVRGEDYDVDLDEYDYDPVHYNGGP